MVREKGSGVKNLLISQVLVVILLYIAVIFYESDPLMTKVVVFLLAAGIIHFAWKGIKALWIKR
jgi:hypothetical protein